MAHIRNLGPKKYQARWTDPSGKPKTKIFSKKSDAGKHLTAVSHAKLSGSYVDPAAGRVTVGEQADEWLASKVNLKPTTRALYESVLSVHIVPRCGTTPVARVEHPALQAWVAQTLLPARRRDTCTRSPTLCRACSLWPCGPSGCP